MLSKYRTNRRLHGNSDPPSAGSSASLPRHQPRPFQSVAGPLRRPLYAELEVRAPDLPGLRRSPYQQPKARNKLSWNVANRCAEINIGPDAYRLLRLTSYPAGTTREAIAGSENWRFEWATDCRRRDPKDFDRPLRQRTAKLKERDFSSVETPLDFLQRHPVDAESISPDIHWDTQHYTRNLIDKTELYELIANLLGGWNEVFHSQPQEPALLDGCSRRSPFRAELSACWTEDLAAHRCNIVQTDVVEITSDNPVAVDPLNPVHDVRKPARVRRTRGEPACVLASVRFLRGVLGGAAHLRRDPLHYTSMYGKLV